MPLSSLVQILLHLQHLMAMRRSTKMHINNLTFEGGKHRKTPLCHVNSLIFLHLESCSCGYPISFEHEGLGWLSTPAQSSNMLLWDSVGCSYSEIKGRRWWFSAKHLILWIFRISSNILIHRNLGKWFKSMPTERMKHLCVDIRRKFWNIFVHRNLGK